MWDDDGGRWHMHDGYGSDWGLMMLLMVVVIVAVAVLLALLLRPGHSAKPAAPGSAPEPNAEALHILMRRLATGEIDEEEFRRRIAALSDVKTP